ncbi:hypothetical protein [Kineosporia succinea]|uniref:Uncharacterized protein n=1 Tax=Kineosporia succinea TaxID=84632 RepID=A0ABT9P5V8_9ACTN|nr:hypothetical protein [Kineosporia succinea]MDP9828068.1 hypothetical protein [Kineosporia succinea]
MTGVTVTAAAVQAARHHAKGRAFVEPGADAAWRGALEAALPHLIFTPDAGSEVTMTTPTDLPHPSTMALEEPEFDELATAKTQRYLREELQVEASALEVTTLLELLRPHIVQSLTASLEVVDPTPYEVRRDALALAVQRSAVRCPCTHQPEDDISLELAPIYEDLLREKLPSGTQIELVDDVDQAHAQP